jgi:hypothetical protein
MIDVTGNRNQIYLLNEQAKQDFDEINKNNKSLFSGCFRSIKGILIG